MSALTDAHCDASRSGTLQAECARRSLESKLGLPLPVFRQQRSRERLLARGVHTVGGVLAVRNVVVRQFEMAGPALVVGVVDG